MSIRVLMFVAIIYCFLSIINIDSTTAFDALILLSLIALYISYVISIVFLLLRKLRGRTFKLNSFHLDRWDIAMNSIAILYIVYVLFFVTLSTIMLVFAINMNYASSLVLVVAMLALVDWVVSGKKRFKIPNILVENPPEIR